MAHQVCDLRRVHSAPIHHVVGQGSGRRVARVEVGSVRHSWSSTSRRPALSNSDIRLARFRRTRFCGAKGEATTWLESSHVGCKQTRLQGVLPVQFRGGTGAAVRLGLPGFSNRTAASQCQLRIEQGLHRLRSGPAGRDGDRLCRPVEGRSHRSIFRQRAGTTWLRDNGRIPELGPLSSARSTTGVCG